MISGILINYITAIAGPHPVDLIITKERTIRDNFTVTDVNGNIVFTVQSSLITFVTPCQHLFLLDAYENPLCIYAERNCYNLVLCSVASIISQPCNVGFLATFNGIIHLSHLWIHYLSLSLRAANDSRKAFRGRSAESKDLIFIRKQSSLFQLREKWNVFLAIHFFH
ncbi:hypothetical protein glysoja_005266 [Glycine soja]|nr:hypothetical protein glysoja_005266 [Glycine soja]